MERRQFLHLVAVAGGGSLAGCGRRGQQSVPTLTPAPIPEETPTPSPTQGISRFSTLPCPDLGAPTKCYHERSRRRPLRLVPVREVTTTTATARFTLRNDSDAPVTYTRAGWEVWRRADATWRSVATGRGPPATRTLAPGGSYDWILVLGDDDPTSVTEATVTSLSLSAGRYAFAVPAAGRTYAALFELVGIRTPGDGAQA